MKKNISVDTLLHNGFYIESAFPCMGGITVNLYKYFSNKDGDAERFKMTLYTTHFFILHCDSRTKHIVINSLKKNGIKDIQVDDLYRQAIYAGFHDENLKDKFNIKVNPNIKITILNKVLRDLTQAKIVSIETPEKLSQLKESYKNKFINFFKRHV